nr:PREDICTED: putative cystathionine gamma-lyase 2 [Bemisia tabaci]XP_018911821.1 PREDICTED: putative cystathionine gamma-lyase 2 [Bemisia tabaci]
MATNGNVTFSPFTQSIDPGFSTRAIHDGQDPFQWPSACVVTPIVTATTFKQKAPGVHQGFEYGRSGNPTRNVLESIIASLDKGKYCQAFPSGLGATTSVINALLKAGDHIICCDDVYGGVNRYFNKIVAKYGIKSDFIDLTNAAELEKTLKPETKMLWMESPTNPLMKVMDLPKLAKIAKAYNKDIIIVADNTFLTSYFCRPLELGADIVLYSLTKYMNGHSDVLMGACVTNSPELEEKLRFVQNACGIIPNPFDCYLVSRSLKTLSVRMEKHMTNGLAVGKYLETHPMVEQVYHPGLPSHPQHAIAKALWSGCSGMLSLYLKGGLEQSNAFLSALKVFILAESLGGYESLADLPLIMTHASVPPEDRVRLGINESLIRLSVGLESEIDLIADLEQALKIAEKTMKKK